MPISLTRAAVPRAEERKKRNRDRERDRKRINNEKLRREKIVERRRNSDRRFK